MSKDYNADFICIVFSVLLPARRYAIAGRGERATCIARSLACKTPKLKVFWVQTSNNNSILF